MLPQEVIRTKRDKGRLTAEAIGDFIAGLLDGRVTEGQAGAFLMAVYFNEMDIEERAALTLAMRDSGDVLRWDDLGLDGPVIDKHSTGGVGDRTSLILAPVFAACGGYNPMISGRGLGHSGGTLDKLESIPGYQAKPDNATFRRVVKEVGCAIVGQTDAIAPADRRLYAIRDVTATVESLSLITASILSKKLAAGLEGLVMDVKFGSGAFMGTLDKARALAESLTQVAGQAGTPVISLLTDMNQVLGRSAGNAVEVHESLDLLCGRPVEPRFREVTIALTAEMLRLGKLAGSEEEARRKVEDALASGHAAEKFDAMVTALGGPADFCAQADKHLPAASIRREVHAPEAGIVTEVDTRAVGMAVVALGGGRTRAQDAIDPAVGLTGIAAPGEQVGPGAAPLAVIHANDEGRAAEAERRVIAAFRLGEAAPASGPLIAARLTS